MISTAGSFSSCSFWRESVQAFGCAASREVAVEQVLVLWWYSVESSVFGEEASVVKGARGLCFLIASLSARSRRGRIFLGDCWAFVCFVGSCAEWDVAEGAG